jgi:hypothetical protein
MTLVRLGAPMTLVQGEVNLLVIREILVHPGISMFLTQMIQAVSLLRDRGLTILAPVVRTILDRMTHLRVDLTTLGLARAETSARVIRM